VAPLVAAAAAAAAADAAADAADAAAAATAAAAAGRPTDGDRWHGRLASPPRAAADAGRLGGAPAAP